MQEADVVIVAANGVGTPRLLLLSESNRFPRGLANSSDQVGRNLMHHGLAFVEAWTRERTDPHQGNISATFISEEFAESDPARGFVNGFTMHIVRLNGAGFQANGSHSGNVAPWARHITPGSVSISVMGSACSSWATIFRSRRTGSRSPRRPQTVTASPLRRFL